ncbi:MAG: 5-oxoprolinase subunit PxpB [Leeuwenhoekiella sp.]
MKSKQPKISRLGKQAILLQWDFEIRPDYLFWLLAVRKKLKAETLKSNIQITNTYNSLLINYNDTIGFIYNDLVLLERLDFSLISVGELESKLFRLPVCYDKQFGLDLDELSSRNSVSIADIIQLHSVPIYTIYFLGFLPGFPYLGGMDERLKISRKNEPRKAVKKGAVGIAENQTGIYPKSSPAGWQIIGNCPVNLFDPKAKNPSPFSAGDRIQFYPVSKAEHEEVQSAEFQFKPES